MSFAATPRLFWLLPRFIETENGESRKAHWLGQKPPSTSEPTQKQGGQKGGPPGPSEARAYRDVASITLGEAQDAYHFFESQLVPSPFPAWIGTNLFCVLELRERHDAYRPPAVFGRVRTCHPSDGYINNIRMMELLFPRADGAPDIVLLHNEDVDATRPVQSYGLRVRFLAAPEEVAEFNSFENPFFEQGLIPEYSSDYINLLNLREQDRDGYPWFYVIGSRWFASIPESVKPEIRESLKNLIKWNKQVFNYHPRSLEPEVRALNWELEFSYGFTEHFLLAPETPADTVKIIASTFETRFQRPINGSR